VLPRGPGPRLLAELISSAATRSSAPDLAFLPRWAPTLPRVPWLRPLPPREESSGAATCSSAPDLASLPSWASALPRDRGLASLKGEFRCCHVPHGPQRAVDHRNKAVSSCPMHAAGLVCVQSTVKYYRGACKACGQAATVWFNSAAQAQLTTLGHGYSSDTIRQDGSTAHHVQYNRVRRHDDSTLLTPCKTSLATPSH
jgi:hypothetical protein